MAKNGKNHSSNKRTRSTASPIAERANDASVLPSRLRWIVSLSGLALVILWAYWPTLVALTQRWSTDANYSHAYLVPLFSLYLLWSRRSAIDWTQARSSWWGLPVLAAGIAMKLAGAYYYLDWLEAISLLPVLLGTTLLLIGKSSIQYAGLAIGFLAFMIPLPFRIETALSLPLQRVATIASTYVLQTIGQPAFAEGNVIVIGSARIGVVEACNGLGMLVLFFAMATAVAILIRRSILEKVILIASAAPIAVAANVLRITTTGLLHATVGGEWANRFFHDFAGWLMMPVALGLLWLELQLMSRSVIEVADRKGPPRLDTTSTPAGRAPRKQSSAGITV